VSAVLAMGVKYAEVVLAVRHRRQAPAKTTFGITDSVSSAEKSKISYFGGAMYYLSDNFSPDFGLFFSFLCIANALVTGNILQTNAAAAVFPDSVPPIAVGIIFAVLSYAVISGSAKRIADVTSFLVPILSVFYILLCVIIIGGNITKIPDVLAEIIRSAFDFRPISCGIISSGAIIAIRYGFVRGIISNEAGCGTSPTAHASANTNNPHKQGVFGIFEVFADTIVICTLTALVILLLPGGVAADGVNLAVNAFNILLGSFSGSCVRMSVVLFAFATVICQAYYGEIAIGYITKSDKAKRLFYIVYSLACIVGVIISDSLMWSIADTVISIMTVINVIALCLSFHKSF